MAKYFTNILFFITILFILIFLFFYTAKTKELFFDSSELPSGTIVILDGKAPNNNGFFIYTNTAIEPPIKWSQIQGELFSVSLAPNGDIWGTDSQSAIYYKAEGLKDFEKIKGELRNINTDGTYVCGTNSKNDIFCTEINDAISGKWNKIGNNAKMINVNNKKAYAINLDNSVSYSTDITDPYNVKWEPVPITYIQFHSISLDGNKIVGINNKNDLYYADENIFTRNPNFTKINVLNEMKNFIHISLKNNSILVTDTSGQLWWTSNYKTPNWIKINTKGKTFMASHITKS
jgi:hypothetical protein